VNPSDIRNLKSTCVTDPARLNWRDKGVYDHKMKGKRDFADLDKVVCNKGEDHVGARQIGPVFVYNGFTTPSVKHHCPCTALASSLRASGNKKRHCPVMFEDYKRFFIEKLVPRWKQKMKDKCAPKNVNLNNWLQRPNFNELYREKMRKAKDPKNKDVGRVNVVREAFAKIEMQFTSVPHEYKDTILNDVKERQICGAQDGSKPEINPAINAAEELFCEAIPEYSGRKNWEQTCEDFETATQDIPNILFGNLDGSGFDQTQTRQFNELFNNLFMQLIDEGFIVLDSDFDRNIIEQILIDSLEVNVSVNRGELRYKSDCRASGDGWTTLANTILMISYVEYTMYIANIKTFFLRVKGDDVIFAFDQKYREIMEISRRKVFSDNKNAETHGLGQICKVINYGDITEVDFLSCYFFYCEGRIRMTRIPERVFQTISFSTKYTERMPIEAMYSLCYQKGSSLGAWGDEYPIIGNISRLMKRLGRPGIYRDYCFYTDHDRVWLNKSPFAYSAFAAMLERRYGINLKTIKQIEQSIDNVNDIRQIVNVPQLALFFQQ
jgi:hypothetical protein